MDAARDFEELRKRASRTPQEFADEAAKIIAREKRTPAYKTPVFKCLEDYEKCKRNSGDTICKALFAICVGRQLIPFIKEL